MDFKLSGYKTYIAAGLLGAVGIVQGLLGIDVPGVELADNWLVLFLNAIGLGGLRAAIGK